MHAVYGASKAFVTHFSKALDCELSPYGIRVLTSCPGVITTNFLERCVKGKTRSNVKDAARKPMTVQEAGTYIMKQLKSKKSLVVFNFRYKILILLAAHMPTSWLYKIFKQRYTSVFKDSS